MNVNYICYYRVSSKDQENSGLGLLSQKMICQNFIKHGGDHLLDEFTEVESGANDLRPQLKNAIRKSIETGAVILVSKLDRISRSVHFVAELMKNNIKFTVAENPQMNELTCHILIAIAENERKMISTRTKNALDAKRKREPNWKPGTPANLNDDLRKKGYTTISNNARTDQSVKYAYYFIKPLRESGNTYQQIADRLNSENFKTRTGKKYRSKQVWDICKRFHICEEFNSQTKTA